MANSLYAGLILIFSLLFATCGEERLKLDDKGAELREIEEVSIDSLDVQNRTVEGEPVKIVIAGKLPSACHLFDRSLIKRAAENRLYLETYATVPFDSCEKKPAHPAFDDVIYISKLPIGHYTISAKGVSEKNFSVIPDTKTGGACATVSLPVEVTSLPSYIPSPGESLLKADIVTSNLCIVPYRLTAIFIQDSLEISASAYDCKSRSQNCVNMTKRLPFEYKIADPPQGNFQIKFVNEESKNLAADSKEEDKNILHVLPASDCLINPAQLSSILFPDFGFVGEELTFTFKGAYAEGNSLSPIKKIITSGVLQFLIVERTCPNIAPEEEVLAELYLEDKFTPSEIGENLVIVNGEEQGKLDILPPCNYLTGEFNLMQVTKDILSGESERFSKDDAINILLTGALEKTCDTLIGVSVTQTGEEFSLRPSIRRCEYALCEDRAAHYHLDYILWGLSDGVYTIDGGRAGSKILSVH